MSIVCIDVNPGRRNETGSLGVVELVDDKVVTRLEVQWPEAAGFAAEWTFVEALIAGRPIAAYGADYDLHALIRLFAASSIPVPDLRLSDAMLAVMDAVPLPYYELQAVSRDLQLWPPSELDAMRAECRRMGAGKWLLASAVDDAEACARVMRYVAGRQGLTVAELVARRPGRRLQVVARH